MKVRKGPYSNKKIILIYMLLFSISIQLLLKRQDFIIFVRCLLAKVLMFCQLFEISPAAEFFLELRKFLAGIFLETVGNN